MGERLESWKEIAAYLKRDESTVRRWEEEGLPVHRRVHKKKATIFAYKSEIDAWWNEGRNRPLGQPVAREVTSIAVLPLKNLSGDPGQEYFVDGMTEALITELGKISSLRVISYQSMIGYRKTAKPLPQIARELKVDALLEGAVLRSGDRVRITANLVRAVPERHLWAETYQFDQQDILAVHGEVARDVAGQIRVKLMQQEQARLTTSRRVNPEAYEAYLLGRAYAIYRAQPWTNWTRAKENFEKAIEKDPGFAPAYASLAELYGRGWVSPSIHPRDLRAHARQWAEKALKLDDTLADSHSALARVAQQEWDWAGAEREYRRAIELNPNDALVRGLYAQYLYGMQRFEEAVAQAKCAQQLDPMSPLPNNAAGAAYFFAGRVEEAIASLQKALELNPSYWNSSYQLARAYVSQGMYQQAIAEVQKALTFNPEEPDLLGALAHAYGRSGQREAAPKVVGNLKRMGAEGRRYVSPYALVTAYAGLGDKDQAFAWLERAYQDGAPRLVWLNVDPFMDPLRSYPRFRDLVRRVGLPIKTPPRTR